MEQKSVSDLNASQDTKVQSVIETGDQVVESCILLD